MAKAAKKPLKKLTPKPAAKLVKAKDPKKEAKTAKKPVLKAPSMKPELKSNAKPKTPLTKEAEKASPADPKKGLLKKLLSKVGIKTTSEKTKKTKAPSKTRREEEEFLPEPMESGEEELPDLGEFEENEETQAPEEDLDADGDADGEDLSADASVTNNDEVILTDAEGRRYCKVKDCDQVSSVDGYCRFHYLLLWKKIQVRRKILVDGKLERYVEELTARYPDKFLEMIRRDLKTEKDFQSAIAELEIDESNLDNEFEDEAQNYIDEVRGVTETGLTEEEEF